VWAKEGFSKPKFGRQSEIEKQRREALGAHMSQSAVSLG